MGSRSRGWRDSADSKGKPRVESHHHKLVRGQKGLYLVSEAAQPCRHLDFELQSSRSGREQISVVSSHLVVLHDVIAAVKNEQNSQEQEKKLFYTHTPTNVRPFMKRIDTLAWIHTSIHHFQGLPDLMSSSLAGLNRKRPLVALNFFLKWKLVNLFLLRECLIFLFSLFSIFNYNHRAYQREGINCSRPLNII